MEIRINETGELKELSIRDRNNIDFTNDLVADDNAIQYNQESEEYEASQETFDWWEEYIKNYESDREEAEALAEELNIDESEIYDRINSNMNCDLEDEHQVKQNVFAEIREENKL